MCHSVTRLTMAINYALVPITTNARNKRAKWTIHAAAQGKETLTTRDIAEHLASHNSPFSVGTIMGILEDMQKCILEQLQKGNHVKLDTLGTFYTTLKSRGANSSEEWSDDYVERINLRWKPSKRMTRDMQGTPLRMVANRAEQHRALKKMAEQANEEINS